MSHYTGSIPVEDVHRWKAEATQRLLGFTIGLSDEQWHAPSPLPGWSRAHIATHLARGADRLTALLHAVAAGDPPPAPVSADERQAELETGADRSGLELQIDLDTSAGALQSAIEKVTDWAAPIVLQGRDATLAAATLRRLHEVCLHHLDLDCGLSPDVVDPAPAAWLLRWVLDLRADADLPSLLLEGESLTTHLGGDGEPRRVSGSDARLWAWLGGRLPASGVSGADGLQPGLLA
ncbi:maleylpyruvate isomerase family mycothiol-dependent enzyme [Propionicimonas sp.]|uniref:maleylpyruvate isomerase family mycothiol-dependent enzyme n=1 Tax=Propionicimonas sp. TaxID=1955623 RepID=UPI0039E68A45